MTTNKKLWFVNKRYGWGWTPSSWEGWVVILFYVIFLFWDFMRLDAVSHSNSDTVRPFVIQTFLATLAVLFICYKKGEKPEWRWGGKKIN